MQRAFRTPASDSPMYLESSSGPLTDKNLVALIRKTACHVNTQHQGEIRWNNWNCELPKQQTDLTYPWSTPRAHRQRLYDRISFMLDPLKSDILDVSTVKWGVERTSNIFQIFQPQKALGLFGSSLHQHGLATAGWTHQHEALGPQKHGSFAKAKTITCAWEPMFLRLSSSNGGTIKKHGIPHKSHQVNRNSEYGYVQTLDTNDLFKTSSSRCFSQKQLIINMTNPYKIHKSTHFKAILPPSWALDFVGIVSMSISSLTQCRWSLFRGKSSCLVKYR